MNCRASLCRDQRRKHWENDPVLQMFLSMAGVILCFLAIAYVLPWAIANRFEPAKQEMRP